MKFTTVLPQEWMAGTHAKLEVLDAEHRVQKRAIDPAFFSGITGVVIPRDTYGDVPVGLTDEGTGHIWFVLDTPAVLYLNPQRRLVVEGEPDIVRHLIRTLF